MTVTWTSSTTNAAFSDSVSKFVTIYKCHIKQLRSTISSRTGNLHQTARLLTLKLCARSALDISYTVTIRAREDST